MKYVIKEDYEKFINPNINSNNIHNEYQSYS